MNGAGRPDSAALRALANAASRSSGGSGPMIVLSRSARVSGAAAAGAAAASASAGATAGSDAGSAARSARVARTDMTWRSFGKIRIATNSWVARAPTAAPDTPIRPVSARARTRTRTNRTIWMIAIILGRFCARMAPRNSSVRAFGNVARASSSSTGAPYEAYSGPYRRSANGASTATRATIGSRMMASRRSAERTFAASVAASNALSTVTDMAMLTASRSRTWPMVQAM